MSDRLDELRRQRALLMQHVAWLDREITAEAAKPPPRHVPSPPGVALNPPPSPATVPLSSVATPAPPSPEVAPTLNVTPSAVVGTALPTLPPAPVPADPDALLAKYRTPPESLKQDVRKGCFLYFTLALALLGLGIAVLWFAFRH